jgi:hypothetical protein
LTNQHHIWQTRWEYTNRLTSSSSSCRVALFRSFTGLGFFTTAVGIVSSCNIVNMQSRNNRLSTFQLTLLNQSDSSGLLARSSMSSCCIARATPHISDPVIRTFPT